MDKDTDIVDVALGVSDITADEVALRLAGCVGLVVTEFELLPELLSLTELLSEGEVEVVIVDE